MEIKVLRNILQANEVIAQENKNLFQKNNVFVINIMSAPGAGKTSLIEKTIEKLKNRYRIAVIEGDIATSLDAEKLSKYGIPVTQINTEPFGGDCHLDANMIKNALTSLDLSEIDLLLIENIGNLVCPAEFYLGENKKVMLLSVTEGEDKPLKYPLMFRLANLLVVSKTDLLEQAGTNLDKLKKSVLQVNPTLKSIFLSVKTGQGMEQWYTWLTEVIQPYRI